MSKIAIKGATTGTGVFTLESPATNTDRTLILPDEAGTVLTSASSIVQNTGAVFKAHNSVNQSVSHNTFAKFAANTIIYNEGGFWDTTNYKFTPTVAGYYQFSASAHISSNTNQYVSIELRKNNSVATYESNVIFGNASGEMMSKVSDVIYLNGTTDYVELFIYQYDYTSNAARNVFANKNSSFISGFLVRTA